jgi:glycosyltransferase involved in cell wall biosynthesis
MGNQSILFFADRLPPEIGGMETHADYFIRYFSQHPAFSLAAIVTRDFVGNDCLLEGLQKEPVQLGHYLENLQKHPEIVFFNSGRWIEDLDTIRHYLPNSKLIYRTGGNEILKAPLEKTKIPLLKDRQVVWRDQINRNINYLITNSDFTERRLSELGINQSKFRKCVGGVNTTYSEAHLQRERNPSDPKVFLCTSRFVPYKNHSTLIDVFNELRNRGNRFILLLVGDGPLLNDSKAKVNRLGLQDQVLFPGVFTNEQVLVSMIDSDFYVQLSTEYETILQGGSYIHAEGMGRSILEAVSTGTFVITTRTGALPEIISEQEGILVDVTNTPLMVRLIEGLILDTPRIKKPTNNYSWQNYFRVYETIFES